MKNSHGIGIAEMIVASGILSVIALGFAQLLEFSGKGIRQNRAVANRDELFNQVSKYAKDSRALTSSAALPENTVFNDCVSGALSCGNSLCCTSMPNQPFVLTDLNGNPVSGSGPASPFRYDLNGSPCGAIATVSCALEVYTTFSPDCGATSPCLRARAITVNFTVRQAPSISSSITGIIFKDRSFSFLSSIPLNLGNSGTPGTLTKWLNNGSDLGDSNLFENALTRDIGIGTSNPIARLDVVKEDSWPGIVDRGYSSGATNYAGHFVGAFARGTQAAPSYPLAGDGLAAFHGRDAMNLGGFGTGMQIDASENHSATAQGANIKFLTIPDGATSPIIAATIAANGSVGIGTAVPGFKLTVDATGQAAAKGWTSDGGIDIVGGIAPSLGIHQVGSGEELVSLAGATQVENFAYDVKPFDAVLRSLNGRILFATDSDGINSFPRMTIDKSGNVGIGTTTPIADLQISNSGTPRGGGNPGLGIAMYGKDVAGNVGLELRTDPDHTAYIDFGLRDDLIDPIKNDFGGRIIYGGPPSGVVDDGFAFITNTATRMVIDGLGNVGLGTSAPQENLHVLGNTRLESNAPILRFHDKDDNSKYQIQLSNDNFTFGPVDNAWRWIHADGTPSVQGVFSSNRQGDMTTEGCFKGASGPIAGSCLSDERLKTDITKYSLGLKEALGLTPRLFRFNGLGGEVKSDQPSIGFVAQEVEKVAPTLAGMRKGKLQKTDKEDTVFKTVNYSALPYVLLNAIQEFYKSWKETNTKTESQISKLEAQIAELRTKIEILQKQAPSSNPKKR